MAIESELEVLKSVVNKLDSSLEKISEVSNSIGKLLAVHDERIGQLEKTSEKRIDDIKELHSRITTQTREIVDKIDDLEKTLDSKIKTNTDEMKNQYREIVNTVDADFSKMSSRVELLERWRWYVLGGAITIGYLIGNLTDILKILK